MSLQLPPRNIFWLVTRKYPAVTRAHFHSKLKNKILFQYFRRQITKFLNHVITIVTKKYFLNDHRKYTAAPRAHSHSKLNKKIFFLNIFVEIQQMLHEDVQEISLQLSPRNMTTENSPLEIQFRNNIQIIFDSTLNSISLTCWRAVIMVVAMPVIYNDCGEASNDCKIVVTDLKTDNYLWQALTLKCWWLIIALKPHLFLCFTLSFYIFKGTWSNETLTKKNTKC